MIDPRFYTLLGPVPVSALADWATVRGDASRVVLGVAALDGAGESDLAYFDASKGDVPSTAAGVLIVREKAAPSARSGAVLILAREPRAHFARVAARLAVDRPFQTDGALIAADARVEAGAIIGPGVVIGPGAEVGAESVIGPNAVIGPGVTIGRRTRIGPGASIVCAYVGDGVTILAGARIGQTGFGVAGDAAGLVDVPHFGRAIIQDGASIGACTTVDRGLFGDTIVAEGAKIDNLCQIAHNVVIGRGAVIAAFGGISGSTQVGDGVMMGGRVGIADHRAIGRGAQLAAGSAVMHDVPAGETWAGYPAKPVRQWLRETAWLSRAIGKRDNG
jgi:UDP-3-O-[3-hydroxymyristoyl] glucosamine N-acyltransferase